MIHPWYVFIILSPHTAIIHYTHNQRNLSTDETYSFTYLYTYLSRLLLLLLLQLRKLMSRTSSTCPGRLWDSSLFSQISGHLHQRIHVWYRVVGCGRTAVSTHPVFSSAPGPSCTAICRVRCPYTDACFEEGWSWSLGHPPTTSTDYSRFTHNARAQYQRDFWNAVILWDVIRYFRAPHSTPIPKS